MYPKIWNKKTETKSSSVRREFDEFSKVLLEGDVLRNVIYIVNELIRGEQDCNSNEG